MPIHVGNQKIKDIYYDSQRIKKAYMGDQLVYSSCRSWWVDTSGVKHYFELENTPMFNFFSIGEFNATITINGETVVKYDIKELVFGDSYKSVTDTNNYIFYKFENLTSVDLSGLSNIIQIGQAVFRECPSLLSLDLTPMANLKIINTFSLRNLYNVKSISFSALEPPIVGIDIFSDCYNLTSIYVPAQSVDLYKQAPNWDRQPNLIKAIET